MNAAMIDDEFNVDSRHLKRPKKAKPLDAIKDRAACWKTTLLLA